MKKLLITKKELMLILVGVTILALGINWFLSPLALVTGGVSGLGIIIETVSKKVIGFGIPLWLTNLACNIPLFIISIRQRGFEFAKKSLYAVIGLSVALAVTGYIPNPFVVNGDLLLGGVFGGATLGLGIGTVLRGGGTTGGTDMLASIIKFKFPNFPIAKLMLFIDAAIIGIGFFIFGSNKAMYAIIAVFITSKVIGSVLEGVHYAKAAFIISDQSETIASEIMEKIPRGTTGLKARGMYSKDEKEMLFAVVSQKEITKLREIISNVDPKAFVTIADVREVLGAGFIEDMDSLSL
ncbi:MAG: YitT family protein [Cellulosilyticaceae bacterium]